MPRTKIELEFNPLALPASLLTSPSLSSSSSFSSSSFPIFAETDNHKERDEVERRGEESDKEKEREKERGWLRCHEVLQRVWRGEDVRERDKGKVLLRHVWSVEGEDDPDISSDEDYAHTNANTNANTNNNTFTDSNMTIEGGPKEKEGREGSMQERKKKDRGGVGVGVDEVCVAARMAIRVTRTRRVWWLWRRTLVNDHKCVSFVLHRIRLNTRVVIPSLFHIPHPIYLNLSPYLPLLVHPLSVHVFLFPC